MGTWGPTLMPCAQGRLAGAEAGLVLRRAAIGSRVTGNFAWGPRAALAASERVTGTAASFLGSTGFSAGAAPEGKAVQARTTQTKVISAAWTNNQ